tara:strand:- start:186746 stop:187816 length:1071 start_codon:yes stop_codon:yes gene_type:complete
MKYFLILLIVTPLLLFGQEKDTTSYKPKIVGIPILFYGPETSLGFGAAGFFTFKLPPQDSLVRPSQINLGAAYTLEKQILTYASYDLWTKNNEFNLSGEVGYYRYFYDFWGVGDEPRIQERYNLIFPRLRFEGVYKVYDNLYAGLKYTFDDFDITEREAGGRLDQGLYPGTEGGTISGAGGIIKYDTRNSNFYPTTGYKIQGSYERFDEAIGSDFNYDLIWIDAIRYFDLKKDKVIAANIYSRFSSGTVPFFHLSQVGGNKRMRGYYLGYHRDKQMIGWQAEYRMPLFWRIGAVAFAGNAVVGPQINYLKIENIRTTAGAGLRFKLDTERKINLRIDAGFSSDGTNGFYLTIGEAF